MAPDKLPLYGEVNRIHMLNELRSRGIHVPDSDYPSSVTNRLNQQNLVDFDPNPPRRQSAAEIYASMYPPSPRSPQQNRSAQREPIQRVASRLASRSDSPKPIGGLDPQSSQPNRPSQQDLLRAVRGIQLSNSVHRSERQSSPHLGQYNERRLGGLAGPLGSGHESFDANQGPGPQSTQHQERVARIEEREARRRGLAQLEERLRQTNGIFEDILGGSVSEASSQLAQGSSQVHQQMNPHFTGAVVNHRLADLPVQSCGGLTADATQPPGYTLPLLVEDIKSTGGVLIQGVPTKQASSVGGPNFAFVVTLGARPEERYRVEQSWQSFFSFGHIQAVRHLLEVHRKKYREETERGEIEQVEPQSRGVGREAEETGYPAHEIENSQGEDNADMARQGNGSGNERENYGEEVLIDDSFLLINR